MEVRLLKLLKYKIILLLILVLALALRVYKLDSIPPGLTWDEAALGYNAYSLMLTGNDEYGAHLPLILKSFGDYKPALYAYLDIPFVMILGLTEIAVRMPSVIAGIGFIWLTYLIIRQIFKDEKLSLITALFSAISPISIQFSRVGFEANVAVFLNMLGAYFFIKGIKKSIYFYGASMAFILSVLCYQGSKIFVPLILFGLFIFFRKEVKFGRAFQISLGLLVVTGIYVLYLIFISGAADRLATQNLFAYRRTDEQVNQISSEDGLDKNSAVFQIIHGDWWYFVRGITERYLIYFSPDTLFVEGDYSPRHSVPDLGILNYYALILLPLGFYLLWRKREKEKGMIIFWLMTASIPAVFSRDLISMVRALNLMFPLAVLEGFGFYYIFNKLSSTQVLIRYVLQIALVILITGNFAYYLDFYFIHLKKDNAAGWLYGYREVLANMPETSKYDRVVMTDNYGQPYIYYLFYKKYDPLKYQKQAKLEQTTVDVGTVRKIDNIEFRKINWPADRGLQNTLLIGTGIEIPEEDIKTEPKSKKLYEINFPDGKEDLKIVENGYE